MVYTFALVLQASLLTDARLEKPANFDNSLTQITDFCARAAEVSGVPLKVETGVSDLKVDVFVENRPLRETLDKVAKALNCEWVKSGDGYRLEMSVPTANREKNFNKAEEDLQREEILTYLWAYKYCAQRTPGTDVTPQIGVGTMSYKERIAILDSFKKAYEEAQKNNDAKALNTAYTKYAAMSSAAGNPSTTGIGRILLQMDKNATDRFFKGEPVVGSTFPNSKYKIYPSDATSSVTSSFTDRYGNTVRSKNESFYFMRYDPNTGMLKCSLNTFAVVPPEHGGGGGSSRMGGPFAGSSTNNEIPEPLKKLPFYQDLATWMDRENEPKKFTQKIDLQTKEWPSIWKGSRRRLGDHLRWFHQATGVPVVAQADRSCLWNWLKLRREFMTATDYVRNIMENFNAYVKEDSGYLVARNYRFWSHRRHEAPESVWSRIEPKDSKTEVTFDQCAAIAAALRQDQLSTTDLGYPVTKFDRIQVSTAYDCLRFVGNLSEAQRTTSSGTGLSMSDLNTTQIDEMQRLLLKLITESGGCSYEMAQYLVSNGLDSSVLSRMRFNIRRSHYDDYGNWSDEIKDGEEVIEKGGIKRGPVDQLNFVFSIGEKETVGQFINLYPK